MSGRVSGPVQRAIRLALRQGQILHTPSQRKPFRIGIIDGRGVELLLGVGDWPTRLSWECLEGIVPFLTERGTTPIGGRHSSVPNPGTLDEHLKGCTPVTTAGWVASLLEEVGVVEVIRERPAKVRLTPAYSGGE